MEHDPSNNKKRRALVVDAVKNAGKYQRALAVLEHSEEILHKINLSHLKVYNFQYK